MGSKESPRRIIMIVTHLHDGGAQYVANTLCEELGARGHSLELWFLYKKSDDFQSKVNWRVVMPVYRLGLFGAMRLFGRLVKEVRAAAPDAVVSHLPLGNVLGQLAAWIAGVPVRVAVQHTESHTYRSSIRKIDRLVGSLGSYTENVAVSETVKNSFESYPSGYRRRVMVIPNGMLFPSCAMAKEQARERLSLPKSVPLIIAIGRLSEQKNHKVLVSALMGLKTAHLAIAGEGELRPMIEDQAKRAEISERLHLLGNLPRDLIPIFLKAGDIWAFPSLFEGLSLSLLEAVNAGLPIVASAIPPNEEVLMPDGKDPAAILLPHNDVEAWRKGLASLIQDSALRDEYAARALERAPLFSLARMIDRYERILVGR